MKTKVLIILTITLILIGAYYFGFLVAANTTSSISKTLVTEVGTDIREKLEFDNYTITSSNVNTEVPGIYQVIYRNNDTDMLKTKEVHVINDFDKSYFMKKIIYENKLSNGSYNVIQTSIDNKQLNVLYSYQTSDTFKHFFSSTINNDLELSETIRMYSKGNIVDGYTFEHEVVYLGTDANAYSGNIELNLYFKQTTNYETITLPDIGLVQPTNVVVGEKYFVVAGSTKEQNEFFDTKRNGEDSFIILINKLTKQIEKMSMFQLNGNDQIKEMICLDNYLYLLQENESNNLRLLKVDFFGNIVKELNLELKYGYKKPLLKLINNNLYLGFSKYDYEVLDYVDVINHIDDELLMETVYYNYNKNYQLKDFTVYNNLYYLLLTNPNSNYGFKYQIADSNKKVLGEYTEYERVCTKGLGSFNEIVVTSTNDDQISYYQIDSLIKLKDPTLNLTYLSTDGLKDYYYLINGHKTNVSEQSNLSVNLNVFGDYKIDYYFEDEFDYYVEKTCSVLPFTGIEHNEIYDIGLEVLGNGTLYVNDELVEVPYLINDEGKYNLKLIGKDGLTENYNIEVKNLSVSFKDKTNSKELNVNLNDANLKYEEDMKLDFLENKEINNTKKTSPFYYLIPAITLGIVFIFIRRG